MASIGTRLRLATKALFAKATEVQAQNALTSFELAGLRAPLLGTKELLEGYSTMPWLRAASGRVGEAVGTTEWKLFAPGRRRDRDRVEGREYQPDDVKSLEVISDVPGVRKRLKYLNEAITKQFVREVESSPLLNLLTGGNEFLPGQQVMKLTQIDLDLTGEAFWLLERDQLRVPRSVFPLVPTWVQRLPTRSDPTYGIQMGAIHQEIPVTEIIRFHEPNPVNPFGRGSGLARTLADELQTDEFAAKLTKLRFVNSGRPDLIVSADDLEKSEVDRLEENWIARTTGFFNKFRPFFAARKLDVKVISQTFADMQVMELRKLERDTIVQIWGMPPEILGILTSSNRSTIHAADFIFSAWVVEPRLEHLRRTLQTRLVPMFDSRLLLDFVSPISEDDEFALKVMKTAPNAFKVNEWRALASRSALPGEQGDALFVPVSGQNRGDGEREEPSMLDEAIEGFRKKDLLS